MDKTTPPIEMFTGANAFLSNFAHVLIEFEGEVYPSVEHAYQAAKTQDLEERKQFTRLTMHAATAKSLGKRLRVRDDWSMIKLRTMEQLLRLKFRDQRHYDMLMLTQPRELIEGNTWGDRYWGVCKGTGRNNLGKLLMKIRDGGV